MSRAATLGLALLLAGCAAGPDFRAPPPPATDRYRSEPLPAQTSVAPTAAGDAQRFLVGRDVPGEWWTLFHSPQLDALVAGALERNPTLAGAQASLRAVQETLAAGRGGYFPTLQASYAFTRERNPVGTLSPTLTSGAPLFNLHTATVSVSYLFDLFGANRRQVESLAAQADAQRYQLEATYLTLTANVVIAAIGEAALREQIEATNDIVRDQREALAIMRRQNELGAIAAADVMAGQSTLAASEAALPALARQLEQQRHLLAALAGRFPGEGGQDEFRLEALALPLELPVSLPAALVRQRPDVLAAEAALHAANAEVGVAVAAMLPQITLGVGAGGASTGLGQLFASGNTYWSAGASLSQTLFAGGALVHRSRAARAALDAAGAQYRGVVLAAFQNVADCLAALDFDAEALAAAARAEAAAAASLGTVRRNLELGSVGYLALLTAQQAHAQALLALAQARASRYADTAALFVALGGGWWNRAPTAPTAGAAGAAGAGPAGPPVAEAPLRRGY